MKAAKGASQYRQRITFEVKTKTYDSLGAEVETWAADDTIGTCGVVGAAYEPLGSREFPDSWKRYDETTARFRIRYQPGIDCDRHRIVMVFDADMCPALTQTFDIFPPLPSNGQRRELTIEAKEIR